MSENSYIEGIFAKARRHDKTIVLPEGEDERVLKAAHLIRKQQIAKLVILGDVESINAHFAKQGWDLDGITLIDPAKSDRLGAYAELLYNLRKEKGLSREDCQTGSQRQLFRNADDQVRRCRRHGFRRQPLHGRYRAPGPANHQIRPQRPRRFFNVYHGLQQ